MSPTRSGRPALGPSVVPAGGLARPRPPAEPALQWIDLSRLEAGPCAGLRGEAEGEVIGLAEAIARDGQREALVVRAIPDSAAQQAPSVEGRSGEAPEKRFELLDGHRRVAALRLLRRGEALARVVTLDDESALYLALAHNLERAPFEARALGQLRARLDHEGRLSPRLGALMERHARMLATLAGSHGEALTEPSSNADFGGPTETGQGEEEEEVELELLAARVRDQLADGCNDLGALYEVWGDLDEGRKEDLTECVRYLAAMLPLLEELGDDDGEG